MYEQVHKLSMNFKREKIPTMRDDSIDIEKRIILYRILRAL